nr:threonine/serine exporter family protein [Ardenticatena sp.]
MSSPDVVSSKPPLSRETLRKIADVCLLAGQLLLQYGADAQRVEETVHRLGTALGAEWLDILVSPNGLLVSTISHGEFRTKMRRVVRHGVNMQVLMRVDEISRRAERGECDLYEVRGALETLAAHPPHAPRWGVIGLVALACAAFNQLMGGDWAAFGITFVAAAVAMWVRVNMTQRAFNSLLVTLATAFTAGVVVLLVVRLQLTTTPQTALTASVLLLVPGVPLIDAAEDLMTGHLVIGWARGVQGGLISMAIALGLWLAMSVLGVPR